MLKIKVYVFSDFPTASEIPRISYLTVSFYANVFSLVISITALEKFSVAVSLIAGARIQLHRSFYLLIFPFDVHLIFRILGFAMR